jgi:type II protein arginine methyltransferase
MPDSADIRLNAGNIACALGRYREAASHLHQARELGLRNDELENNLAVSLKELGRLDEARTVLEGLLKRNAGHARAWNTLAAVHLAAGRENEAEQCIDKALSIDPDSEKARENRRRLRRRRVPMWHFAMMNDDARNSAFEKAIAAAVTGDSLVLDIGTGSGLLAMMAARCGADRVVACEMVPAVAETARRIIEANGLSDRISVLARKSTDLQAAELPRPADVLIAEVFDAGFFGEEALDTIEDARRRLLSSDARLIPAEARIVAAPVESPELYCLGQVDEVAGFNLSAFNEFRPRCFQHGISDVEYRMLAEPVELFRFDLQGELAREGQVQVPLRSAVDGTAHAVVCWFELRLAEGVVFSTSPQEPGSHWDQSVHILSPAVWLGGGRSCLLSATHDRRRLTLSLTVA